jgi:hypothetical protein
MEEQNNQRDGRPARRGSDSEGVNTRAAAGLDNDTAERMRPISEKKLAANRANAQRSTGPKTTGGKVKSSRNSYKHGLCSQHLFRPGPQGAADQKAYEKLAACIRNHYKPERGIEELLVDKIVAGMVRYARIGGHEQQALGEDLPFKNNDIDNILRYSISNERQLMRCIRELERIQAAREDASGHSEEFEAGAEAPRGRFPSQVKGRCGSETLTQFAAITASYLALASSGP